MDTRHTPDTSNLNSTTSHTDDIARAALQSEHTYTAATRRYYGRVYLSTLAMVRQPEMAEDIAQETFLRAWLRRDTIKDPHLPLQPWLIRIARNLAIDWLRTGQQRSRVLPLISIEELSVEPADNTNPNPRQSAGQAEQHNQLTHAVMALPEDLRQAVLLHYAEGLTPSDIARLNGEAPSTVTRRLDKARQLLRQHIESGLAANLAASVQQLRPRPAGLQRSLGIATAAAALPAATHARLLQLVSDTPPPPLIDPVTSAATAAPIKEPILMKSIIAKAGAAKLLAAAAIVLGGGLYAINTTFDTPATNRAAASSEAAMPRVQTATTVVASPSLTAGRRTDKSLADARPRTASAASHRRETLSRKPNLTERIALLKTDLVSTRPEYIQDDGKTSGGIHLDMLVVNGSGQPVKDAALMLNQLSYKEADRSGSIGFNIETTGTISMGGGMIYPAHTNAAGIARFFVPAYANETYRTKGFAVKATHPDYTATFADMELTSVTKIVMTGGQLLEVIPVDAATSAPILTGVVPHFDTNFQPEWEQRPDGTIAVRKISGDSLSFHLKQTDTTGRDLLSPYHTADLPQDEPLRLPLHPGLTVKGTVSANVPRPVSGGKVKAIASVKQMCSDYGAQDVTIEPDGSFTLTSMPAGDIIVAAIAEGYASTKPDIKPNTTPHSTPHRFHLTTDQQPITIPMEAMCNLRLTLTNPDGTPAPGVSVQCFSMMCFDSCCNHWGDNYTATSGADGVALINGIPAGQVSHIRITDGWELASEASIQAPNNNPEGKFDLQPGETLERTLVVVRTAN